MGIEQTRPPGRRNVSSLALAVGAGVCLAALLMAILFTIVYSIGGRHALPTATISSTLTPTPAGLAQGLPCAVNTPHATLARGEGIVAAVFLWSLPLPATATPTVEANGMLSSMRETVCVMRESDGALIAHYDISATGVVVGPNSIFAISPDSGVLYASGVTSTGATNPVITTLCAWHALTGKVMWCKQTNYIYHASVGSGALYVETGSGLDAFDATSGNILWQIENYGAPDNFLPILLDGSVIYGDTTNFSGPTDQFCAWRVSNGRAVWCRPISTYRSIVLTSESDGYITLLTRTQPTTWTLQELRALDGASLWQKPFGDLFLFQPDQILNAGASLYVVGENSNRSLYLDYEVVGLNVATGAQEWTHDDGQIEGSLVGNGDNFIEWHNGTMLGYMPASLTSPDPSWQQSLTQGRGEMTFFSPTTAIYLIGTYAVGSVRLSDGKHLWQADESAQGTETAPAHLSDGAIDWGHWSLANSNFEAAVASGGVYGGNTF